MDEYPHLPGSKCANEPALERGPFMRMDSMPQTIEGAVEWAYERLLRGVAKPSSRIESEIKRALRDSLKRAKTRSMKPAERR
jgi:hypothetical protein